MGKNLPIKIDLHDQHMTVKIFKEHKKIYRNVLKPVLDFYQLGYRFGENGIEVNIGVARSAMAIKQKIYDTAKLMR